jgi:hypothetical protein
MIVPDCDGHFACGNPFRPRIEAFAEGRLAAEDGPTVFAHACLLGAEGIVSKKVDGTYRSGPCRAWIKVHNPASVAVRRERSEIWTK